MNIFIIGGTGFLGRHVTRLLNEQGHRLTLFHRHPSDLFAATITQFHGHRESLDDLKRAFDATQPDLIVDTCAMLERYISVLDQAVHGTKTRLVLLSSIDVYKAYEVIAKLSDTTIQPLPLTETSSLRDMFFPYRGKLETDYAHDYDKILVEKAAFSSEHFETTVVRLGMVYGEHDPNRRFGETVRKMKENAASIFLPKSLAGWRGSKIYVGNAAHGIAMISERKDMIGETFNLAEEHPLTEKEWTEAIARLMEWHGTIRLEESDSISMNTLSINPMQDFIADSSKFRSLGYREPISFEEGLRRTIEWESKQMSN